jgi:ABC-type molybdenum transport system ATPase subunit/photorepair protein PhrA
MRHELIARLIGVSVARAARRVLADIHLEILAGDRIYVSGDNGAGKTSLLYLLAGRLHPWQNAGQREFPWLAEHETLFHLRRHVALISRDEQLRLQKLYVQHTVREFLLGHADGDDFLYRDVKTEDKLRAEAAIERWQLQALVGRRLKTLSLGEMRLATIARADMFERRLYLLDEVLNSLSENVAERVTRWISEISESASLLMTGHVPDRAWLTPVNRQLHVENGVVSERAITRPAAEDKFHARTVESKQADAAMLVHCKGADFYHDFNLIFKDLSFTLHEGDRILLTGPNGSGKTTLLRILHGDFRPAWQSGVLEFKGALAHAARRELWQKVQLVAAAHFDYFLPDMSVAEVLASRLSGSLYEYENTLPQHVSPVLSAFTIDVLLDRRFTALSEGEKTRVLLARAFLEPAPVYLIDEGFMALSDRYFSQALAYLNALPDAATVVIAANERIHELKAGLGFKLADWQLAHGRLTTLL